MRGDLMGISLFGRKREQRPPSEPPAVRPASAAPDDGRTRLTANEWALKLQVSEVAAERAAMRAGRWHGLFTEEEFMELLKRQDV